MKKLIFVLLLFVCVQAQTPVRISSVDSSGVAQLALIYGYDRATNALNVILYAHHEVHSGSAFSTGISDADLDNGDTLSIAFTTPNTAKWFHMVGLMKNTSESFAEVVEAPTLRNGSGTERTVINRNRNSAKTSGSLSIEASATANEVSTGVANISEGSVISSETIGTGRNKGEGEARALSEIILKQNTTYLFRIVGTADNGNATIKLVWYEHTNKN